MTARTLDFDFAKCKGPQSGESTVDGEFWRWSKYVPTMLRPAFGRQIITNGVNANSQIPFGTILPTQGSIVVPLIMAAPSACLYPLLSAPGTGRVFGNTYKWRLRYKNSATGDVSGLGPVPPWALSLGIATTAGADTYLGQTAIFRIASGVNDVPAYCDTIQLFRNGSGNYETWYLVDEQLIGSQTYVQFVDDTIDDDLFLNESSNVRPNPSFAEGAIPPMVKQQLAATGRLELFGMRRMGPYRAGTVSVTVGSTTVTRTNSTTCWDITRIGQAFRLKTYSGSVIDDTTVYRINAVGQSGDTLTVTPDIQISTQLATDGATYASVGYEILDDRDARTVYQSKPGSPTNFDLLEAYGVGLDADDLLLHMFVLRGVKYGHTLQGLYRVLGDVSTEPSSTIVLQRVSSEGTVGFESGCVTPEGWVYVHPQFGLRLFDGNAPPQGYETLGTITPARPLGGSDETQEFLPYDQFFGRDDDAYSPLSGMSRTGFDPDLLSECRCVYDPQEHLVHVFYVPSGQWSLREELAYDETEKCWRGPWRRGATATGFLKNADGTETFLFGGDRGELWIDNKQALDMYPATSAAAASTSGSEYVLVNSGASFDSTTQKEMGCPVVLYAPSDANNTTTMQSVPIADVINGTTLILERDAVLSGNTYTYRIGAIRWLVQGAWIDGDEPVQPKEFEQLRARLQRAASGASDSTWATLKDGDETLANATGEGGVPFTLTSYSTTEPAYRGIRTNIGSRLFAILAYGTNTTTDPRVTKLIADVRVDGGN